MNKKIWPTIALVFGMGACLAGALLIYAYLSEAVIARIGEPDQSLLFWYSPFLMCGALGLLAGLGLGISGFIWLRRIGRPGRPGDERGNPAPS